MHAQCTHANTTCTHKARTHNARPCRAQQFTHSTRGTEAHTREARTHSTQTAHPSTTPTVHARTRHARNAHPRTVPARPPAQGTNHRRSGLPGPAHPISAHNSRQNIRGFFSIPIITGIEGLRCGVLHPIWPRWGAQKEEGLKTDVGRRTAAESPERRWVWGLTTQKTWTPTMRTTRVPRGFCHQRRQEGHVEANCPNKMCCQTLRIGFDGMLVHMSRAGLDRNCGLLCA